MARTRNYNIYYQNDYLQDADVIEDNKTTAESVDEALGTIDQKVESNTQNINNNTNNIELNARNIEDLQTAVAENSSDIENLENAVANKVDKVTGKGLSTNDFTNEYKNQVDTNKSNIETLQTDLENANSDIETLQTDLENANSDIETLQGDVETALSGKEDSSNKVTSIDENSTNTQYPGAKLVYDELVERDEEINQLWNDHPDITDTGTDITLQGTGDLKMKVDVGGNSTQETTSTSEGDEYDSPSPEHKQDINNVEGNVVVISKNSDNTKSNSVTFPLSQGQKLMLGDTLEDDGIHHKRGQIVLTGNENISSSIYGTNSYILGLPARAFVDETITLILSSHFKGIPANQRTTEPPNCIYVSTASLIEVRNTEFATLQEFKAWLAQQYANNTPVIVEYKLETETITPYTSAQQIAYNKLKEMQSYYDLTHVVGSSDNAQPILTAHAKKSIKQLSGGDLSNYQTKITSTNKLNSDLVNDTNQTNKFVTTSEKNTWDAKQNTTDNNLATTNKNITSAINEVNSIAKGANQALSYASYSAMITAFNSTSSTDYNVGQNIYIETLEVPDLWVYKVESTSSSYTYTTDSAFTTALETNGYVQVGYYKLSALETQKVDLTNYVEFTDYASSSTAGVGKIGTATGINISAAGVFYIASATSSEINAKTNSFKPIVPTNLDYAVSNIVGHHVTLTQTQYDALETKVSDTYYYIVEE